jgi:hypothetical protein
MRGLGLASDIFNFLYLIGRVDVFIHAHMCIYMLNYLYGMTNETHNMLQNDTFASSMMKMDMHVR